MKAGEEVLNQPVSRVNLETGRFEPAGEGTNKEALVRYPYITIILLFSPPKPVSSSVVALDYFAGAID